MRRLGKVYITKELFANPPKEITELLNTFTVLSLKHIHTDSEDKYEVIAEYVEFDEIDEHTEIPIYTFTFQKLEDGSILRLPIEKINEKPIFDYGAFDRPG